MDEGYNIPDPRYQRWLESLQSTTVHQNADSDAEAKSSCQSCSVLAKAWYHGARHAIVSSLNNNYIKRDVAMLAMIAS